MRKNAAGLATISILSTMVLVTLTGSLNIFIGGQNYLDTVYPSDYMISVGHMPSDAEIELSRMFKLKLRKQLTRHICQIIRWHRQHTGQLKFERLMEGS